MPQCMDKYKNDFAIEFAKIMQENLPQWKTLQKKYINALWKGEKLFWYIGCFLFAYLPGKRELNYDLNFHIFMSIMIVIFVRLGENDLFAEFVNCEVQLSQVKYLNIAHVLHLKALSMY